MEKRCGMGFYFFLLLVRLVNGYGFLTLSVKTRMMSLCWFLQELWPSNIKPKLLEHTNMGRRKGWVLRLQIVYVQIEREKKRWCKEQSHNGLFEALSSVPFPILRFPLNTFIFLNIYLLLVTVNKMLINALWQI